DAIERALAELREFAGDVLAAKDPMAAQRLVDAGHALAGLVEVDHELLEEAAGELDVHALDAAERLRRVMPLLQDQLAHLPHSLWAQERQVHGIGDCPEIDRVAGPVLSRLAHAVGGLMRARQREAMLPRPARTRDADEKAVVLAHVLFLVARG